MFNFFKKNEKPKSFEETRKEEIEKLIKEAFQNIVNEQDVARYEELLEKPELTDQEDAFCTWLEQKVEASTIKTQTLFDFKVSMELLGLSPEYVKDVVEHENAHANKAEQLGVPFTSYRLTLFRGADGQIYPQPSFSAEIPDESKGWDKSKQKRIHKEIILAPKAYGNKLSDSDKYLLGKLDQKYGE